MKKFNIKLLLLLLIFSPVVYAGANVWTGPKTVTSVQVVEHGGFLIGFDSVISSACTDGGTNRLYVYANQGGVTQEGVKSFLSVALTALSSGMKVNVLYDDSTILCWASYITIEK